MRMEAACISEESENSHRTTYCHVLLIVTVIRTSTITFFFSGETPGADYYEEGNEICVPK
jgi:hypothetical protein